MQQHRFANSFQLQPTVFPIRIEHTDANRSKSSKPGKDTFPKGRAVWLQNHFAVGHPRKGRPREPNTTERHTCESRLLNEETAPVIKLCNRGGCTYSIRTRDVKRRWWEEHERYCESAFGARAASGCMRGSESECGSTRMRRASDRHQDCPRSPIEPGLSS